MAPKERFGANRRRDKLNDLEIESQTLPDADGGEGGDAGADPGGAAEEGGDTESLFAADQPTGDLLTGLDQQSSEEPEEDEERLSIDDDDAPIKAQNAIMNAFGQPIQKDRKVRFGSNTTHTPDFLSMTGVGSTTRGQDSLNKPYGSVASGSPFKESYEDTAAFVPPRLTYDMVKTLNTMKGKINIPKHELLNESEDS